MQQETPLPVLDYGQPRRSVWRRIMDSKVMCAFTIILSLAGVWLMLVVADLRWGFVHLHLSASGPEGGLILLGLAFFTGIGVSVLATLLAILQLRRTVGSRLLLVWCCVVLFGFALVYVA